MRVWEWFEYHRVIVGMDAAVIYNAGGVTKEMRAWLGDYYKFGWVEEVDFLDTQTYKTWYNGQVSRFLTS